MTDTSSRTVNLSFKYRLLPTKKQHAALKNILHKAKLGLEIGNVTQWGERRSGNTERSI